MKKLLSLFVFLALFVAAPLALKAQDTSGMTGQVTDATGAAVPGVVVTLTNHATGVHFTAKTDAGGTYRFANIPPGSGYEAVFAANGFSPFAINNLTLLVAQTRTQNAKLQAGANVEVQVNGSNSEVTIDTTDATIGNDVDVKQLNSLPVQQRSDPTALFTLQPGVTDAGSVTGARVDQNDVTLDGLDVNDFATGGAVQSNAGSGISSGFTIVGHAPVDSIEEFRGTVGGFTSDSGPASGGQFALVTKSGTNQFHGNINEYHRDPDLVANSWFNNNSSPVVPRNHLIQNQFGGNLGGPIIKNKLFFFFDYNNSRIIASQTTLRSVPLSNFRTGNIQYLTSADDGTTNFINPSQIAALDPSGAGIDYTWLDAVDARFPIANDIPAAGDGLNSGGYVFNAPANDFLTNYVGRVDYHLTDRQSMFARFSITRENAVDQPNEFAGDPLTSPEVDRTYAFVIGHNWAINDNMSNSFFIGETVQKLYFPIDYNPGLTPTVTASSDAPGATAGSSIPGIPEGNIWYTTGDGTGPSLTSTPYLQPNAQSRRVPIPVVGDNFVWTKHSHTWEFGGTFKDIYAQNKNVGDYNSVEEGMGGNLFALCGPTYNECSNDGKIAGVSPTASLRPSDIDEGGANLGNTAIYDYDSAFADILGRVAEVSSDYNYNKAGTALPQLTGDIRHYRYYQTMLYADDTWKATPSLTVSYGVNYQYFSVPYETNGYESVEQYTYDQYMAARIAQSSAGLSGPNAVPLIDYSLGGKANNGPPMYQPQHKLFAPRVAFAYNPSWDKKTVFNAGAGLVYDRTIINAVQFVQDEDSYLFQLTNPIGEGTSADPYHSIQNGPRLDSKNGLSNVTGIAPPAPPTAPYAPFDSTAQCGGNPTPCGLALGSAFNATIDPALKVPYSITFNAGMQHTFPGDMVLKMSYDGRLGRRLLAQADANQVLDFPDAASGQFYSVAFGNVTKQLRAGVAPGSVTPQPWFEDIVGAGATQTLAQSGLEPFWYRGDIGDFTEGLTQIGAVPLNVGSAAQFSENTFYTSKGFSSYNALLVSLQKNLSHGLQFDVNYTFGHSIDNVSLFANSSGDTGIGGVGLVCDDIRPRECRANSDFDITNYITADFLYQLPFGRGRAFASSVPVWLNEVIGGWDISGITDWHTGQAWGTNSDAFDASYSNDAPAILIGQKPTIKLTKYPTGGINIFANNQAAAAAYEGPIGFQIGSRNSLRGPNYFDEDMGLAKEFPIYAERVRLQFRADAFNVFNHPNFQVPSENGYNGLDNQDFTNVPALGSGFGQISYQVQPSGNLNNGSRVLQLSLRLEF